MVICINQQCKNYKQELESETESCPLCGEKTGMRASKINQSFAIAAIITAIVGAVVAWVTWNTAGIIIGAVLAAAGIALGIMSKSKGAIAVSVFILLCIGAWLLMFGVI